MKTHHHFTVFHFLLMLFLTGLIIFILSRSFQMSQASIEEVSVNLSILSMKQSMYYQNLVSRSGDPQCKFLNKADLFQQQGSLPGVEDQKIGGTWYYNNKKHELIYNVQSKNYFRSKFKQKIVIDLYCKEGMVIFKESEFQWCHHKKVWGCKAW